jgi:hypothetical protein
MKVAFSFPCALNLKPLETPALSLAPSPHSSPSSSARQSRHHRFTTRICHLLGRETLFRSQIHFMNQVFDGEAWSLILLVSVVSEFTSGEAYLVFRSTSHIPKLCPIFNKGHILKIIFHLDIELSLFRRPLIVSGGEFLLRKVTDPQKQHHPLARSIANVSVPQTGEPHLTHQYGQTRRNSRCHGAYRDNPPSRCR